MPERRAFALTGAAVFTGERIDSGRAVVIGGDTIQAVVAEPELPAGLPRVTLNGGLLAPGFIDLQVNGGGGILFNDHTDRDGLRTILAAHRRFGTTGLMATLISDTPERQAQAAEAVRAALAEHEPGLLGLHLEGPHLNPARAGVHAPHHLRAPTADDIDRLAGLGRALPLLVTLAPEVVGVPAIARLAKEGILVAAGHTAADYPQMIAAFRAGVRCVTHLFNAMTALTSREPGAVGAALDAPEIFCGIIADGYHVHDATLRIACRSKPTGKLFLVTDAMAPVGAGTDRRADFLLQGMAIQVADGRCQTADGRLAGSALDMTRAVRHCVDRLGLTLEEALRMAALYPATCLGLGHRLGRIAPGYRADLVWLDNHRGDRNAMNGAHGETYGSTLDDSMSETPQQVLQTWIAGTPNPEITPDMNCPPLGTG